MEKPVRRKASFVRYDAEGRRIKGHKGAQSSGSGAGVWMAKGRQAAESSSSMQGKENPLTDGRRYHIPATIATTPGLTTDMQKIMLSKRKDIQTSDSGDVDLDLSFDFVSKLEKDRINKTGSQSHGKVSLPSSPRKQNQEEKEINQTNTTPRGMSTADWGARQRKKPPTPLSLGKNRDSQGNMHDLTSRLSPESPTMRIMYDDEPLMIVPISATRRAADAGIVNSLDSIPSSSHNLIQLQRSAAAKRQNEQQISIHQESPGKRLKEQRSEHSSPKKIKQNDSSNRINRQPFGENMKANNAQLVRATEEVHLFYDERSDEIHSQNQFQHSIVDKRISNNSFFTPGNTNSEAHEPNSNRYLRSRRPSAIESVESSNHSMPLSYKTAKSKPSAGGHGGSSTGHSLEHSAYLPSPSAENVLGIFYPAKHVPIVSQIQETLSPSDVETSSEMKKDRKPDSDDMSPLFTQKSTPLTPYSPLFSDNCNGENQASSSVSSTGGRTPLTAVSTLFGDRLDTDGKQKLNTLGGAVEMVRGATTPNPVTSIATQVIREESSLSLDRPPSIPASESMKITKEISQMSIDTDESLPQGYRRRSMVVNTTVSPNRKQNSFDLTDITGTRAKKGPWPQSPLLLETDGQSQKRRSNTLSGAIGGGVGLGLSLGDDGKVGGRSDYIETDNMMVNRTELPQIEVNHLGLDLGHIDKTNLSDKSTVIAEIIPVAPTVTDNKLLYKSTSRTSTIEGFAINITPAHEHSNLPVRQPEHRVDVPISVVDIDEIIAAGNVGGHDSRNRWSSKLWSMTSAFRSPARSTFEDNSTASSPPMRTLTLVGKQRKDILRGQSVKRSASREDLKRNDEMKKAEVSPMADAYHSMPSSSVMPGTETFTSEGVTRPAAARYIEARSSKHTKRMSRIQYLKVGEDEDHVQVNMDSIEIKPNTALDRALLDMIKSPRIADSPTGTTPHLGTFVSANVDKSHRRSWTANNFTASPSNPTSSPPLLNNNTTSAWLMPKRQSLTGARDSELYALADKMRTFLNEAGEGNVDEDAAAVEAMLSSSDSKEEGLRRRNNHRSINSVPNTPTFMVDGWDEQHNQSHEPQEHQGKLLSYHASKYDAKGSSIAFQEPDLDYDPHRADGRQSRMNMYARPRSGLNFFQNMGSRIHAFDDQRFSMNSAGPQPPRKQMGDVYADHRNDVNETYTYRDDSVQRTKPSQTIFFAGFLLMPWLWFVGGWILENDGTYFIQHEKKYSGRIESGQERSYNDDESFASPNNDPYASGRKSRAGWYNREEASTSTGIGAGSIIIHEREPKNNQNRFSRLSNRLSKIIRSHDGMGSLKNRRQLREEEMNRFEEESVTIQVARRVFDWRELDRYVVLNRVMAILASFIVFTGFGLAIAAIVVHF